MTRARGAAEETPRGSEFFHAVCSVARGTYSRSHAQSAGISKFQPPLDLGELGELGRISKVFEKKNEHLSDFSENLQILRED